MLFKTMFPEPSRNGSLSRLNCQGTTMTVFLIKNLPGAGPVGNGSLGL